MSFLRDYVPAACAMALWCFMAHAAMADERPARQPLPVATLARTMPIDFEKEILPIFKANCLACHNRTKAKASLVLETPADILKGGDSGPAVIAKQSDKSPLFRSAAHLDDPIMPPRENKVAAANLSAEQLALLKRWIDEGATGAVRGESIIKWQPIPQHLAPIYAVAVTRDGQYAAAGRGNQIAIYHLPTRKLCATIPAAHLDLVQSLAFSPDGTTLASGAYREIKLWRRSAPTRVTLAEAQGPVTAIISAAGRTAVGCADGSIRVIDDGGKTLSQWKAHDGSVVALDFSADGSRLSSISADKTLRLWDAVTAQSRGQLAFDSDPRALVDLHQSEGKIVVACADNTLRVCAPPAQQGGAMTEQRRPSAHSAPITSLARIPAQPAQFVSAGQDDAARVWDLTKDAAVRELKHGAAVAVAARPDGKRIATAGADNLVRLWDADGKLVAVIKGDRYLTEAAEEAERALVIAASDVAFHKARQAAADKEQKSQAERVKKATEALAAADKSLDEKHDAHFAAVTAKAAAEKAKAEKPDDKALADKVTFQTNHLRDQVRALEKAQLVRNTTLDELELARKASSAADAALAAAGAAVASAEASHKSVEAGAASAKKAATDSILAPRSIAFSPDGSLLAVGGVGRVHTFSTETGAAVDVIDVQTPSLRWVTFASDSRIHLAGDDRTITALSVAATWTLDATLAALPATGTPSADLPSDRVNALDFSSDGMRLAAGSGVPSRGGDVLLYDVPGRKLIKTYPDLHSDSVLSLDLSPDGRFLASGGADKFARILDLATDKPVRHFEGHTHHILGVAWKRDGRTLATAGADNVVKIWNAITGDRGKTIPGFSKEVTAVAYLGVTDQILSVSGDPRVRIVNEAGAEARSLTGALDFLHNAAVTADGKTIVAGGQDGVLRVWDAATQEPKASFK